MNKQDFNALVDRVLKNQDLASMRPVVEKELLHYEIFQALDAAGLLKHLVFQGGTCLRLCRGSERFSEALDFAGGTDFTAERMSHIKTCIENHIGKRYGLNVTVKEPKALDPAKKTVSVDTWWIAIETAPENPAMPKQKIKLEIANIAAYETELVPLRLNYEFLGGMKEVLVNAESISEILADKLVAFPTSLVDNKGEPLAPGARKIRHRDIWDIAWLIRKGARLNLEMVLVKVKDYGIDHYATLVDRAIDLLPQVIRSQEFKNQMERFIDAGTWQKTLNNADYLTYLISEVTGQFAALKKQLPLMTEPKRS